MSARPPSGSGLPLGSDGYPAAGGVARRPAGDAESARANRRWWDAAAPAYLAEHGSDLGDADFLWCPEGLREADARLLGDVARTAGAGDRVRIGALRALAAAARVPTSSRWTSRPGCWPAPPS